MQKFVMVSRNIVSEPVVATLSGRDPMAHQFDSVHGNEPTPQIMIQLIGCNMETRAAHIDGSRHLKASA